MKEPKEMTIEELGEAIDEDAMSIGLAVAEIFKTVTAVGCRLPNMELHTETICLSVDDSGISVYVGRPGHSGQCYGDDEEFGGYDDFDEDFDDEEERIYDEID